MITSIATTVMLTISIITTVIMKRIIKTKILIIRTASKNNDNNDNTRAITMIKIYRQ